MSAQPIDYEELLDLTLEEREALPAIHHRPVFDGLGQPNSWLCAVCWDEGVVTGWPCEAATRGGHELANLLGLESYR